MNLMTIVIAICLIALAVWLISSVVSTALKLGLCALIAYVFVRVVLGIDLIAFVWYDIALPIINAI